MSEQSVEQIVELDLGVVPEAAVSGALLVEDERSTFLAFNAMSETDEPSPYGGFMFKNAGIALVQFSGCSITKFGYPNDEAYWGIPKYRDCGYGIYEVKNSNWVKELTDLNRYSFPNTPDNNSSRHFLFMFHDSTFECIAEDLILEVFTEPRSEVFERIRKRLFRG
jgi:hypothetical protein